MSINPLSSLSHYGRNKFFPAARRGEGPRDKLSISRPFRANVSLITAKLFRRDDHGRESGSPAWAKKKRSGRIRPRILRAESFLSAEEEARRRTRVQRAAGRHYAKWACRNKGVKEAKLP